MNSFNFTANVGADMEVRYLASGTAIGTCNVAVTKGYGEHKKTTWVRLQLWGKRAESLVQYITKGKRIGVTGEFYCDEWQDKDGNKRLTPCVDVQEIELPRGEPSGGAPEPPPGFIGDTGDDIPF